MTYEEAMVSEQEANERIRQFPEEFKGFVLQNVQFSKQSSNPFIVSMIMLADTVILG